jgi:hypothetical protein
MTLSTPKPRQLFHTRQVTFHGYHRDDGLWDIEAELLDTKARDWPSYEQGVQPPDAPIHHMLARLTLDDGLIVVAIEASMRSTPFAECMGSLPGLQKLVGARVASGWRKAIDTCLGSTAGCTHMREMLISMGTAAFQTLSRGNTKSSDSKPVVLVTRPPPHLGQCMAWDFDGPVVERHRPEFYRWRP